MPSPESCAEIIWQFSHRRVKLQQCNHRPTGNGPSGSVRAEWFGRRSVRNQIMRREGSRELGKGLVLTILLEPAYKRVVDRLLEAALMQTEYHLVSLNFQQFGRN